MSSRFLFILLLLQATAVMAQEQAIDSMERLLAGHQAADTTRLSILYNLAYAYADVDPDKGMEMAEAELALAGKLYLNKEIGWAHWNKGLNYFAKDDYKKALEYYRLAAAVFEQSGDKLPLATTNNSIAIVYYRLADYTRALAMYLSNLRIYEQAGNKKNVAVTLGNIGLTYQNMGDDSVHLQKALAYHQQALQSYRVLNNSRGIANELDHIGSMYDGLNQPRLAIGYYQQALAINDAAAYTKGIAQNLANLGIAFLSMADYPNALLNSHKAFTIHAKIGAKRPMAISLANIGNTILEAPPSLLQQQGIPLSARYNEAINYNKRALVLLEQTEDVAGQSEIWENTAKIYLAKKDYKLALEAYRKQVQLRDSISNDDQRTEIDRLELQFEFEKKEALLKAGNDRRAAIAAVEIKRQATIKTSVITGAAVLFIATLLSFIFYKKKRDAIVQRKEAELKAEISDNEMKVMRLQMNPHFIFNSLNSISDYIAHNEPGVAQEYLGKFAKVMRMTLEHSEQTSISLEEDLKALEAYIQLEARRLNGKFDYQIEVAGDIDTASTMVPPMIFQPFVENSIWHGIANKEGRGHILVSISRDGEMLNCLIDDDGIGREKSPAGLQAGGYQSLGMKITKARIDIINKVKRSAAAVELSDLAEGMRVQVKLPLELSF